MPLCDRNCPLLPLSALAYMSLVEDGPVCSQLALLRPLFCEWAWQCLSLGLFAGLFSLSFSLSLSLSLSLSFFVPLSLWLSHSLGCYLKLVL